MARNKKILTKVQPIMIPPTSSIISLPASYYFLGPELIPLGILIFSLIRYSPSIAVVVKELARK